MYFYTVRRSGPERAFKGWFHERIYKASIPEIFRFGSSLKRRASNTNKHWAELDEEGFTRRFDSYAHRYDLLPSSSCSANVIMSGRSQFSTNIQTIMLLFIFPPI